MGIKRPFSVGDGFVAPETPEGGLYALVDGTGKYYSAGFEGATQKHPLPLTGGQRIFLGTGGLTADASSGYNVITGTGVSQTADGLEVTLSASNTEVIIDLPVFGEVVPESFLLELTIAGASPGDGNYVGWRMDSNLIPYEFSLRAESNGSAWVSNIDRAGSGFPSSQTVAFGSVSSIEYICGHIYPNESTLTVREAVCSLGAVGSILPVATSAVSVTSTSEDISVPTTFDMAIAAKWVSGSDLVLTLKYVSMSGDIVLTTVP